MLFSIGAALGQSMRDINPTKIFRSVKDSMSSVSTSIKSPAKKRPMAYYLAESNNDLANDARYGTGVVSPAEKAANQNLAVALTSLGLAIAGSLIYAPLGLLSVPGLIYTSSSFVQNTYQLIFKERKIGIALVDSISVVATLLMGYYVACALYFSVYYLSRTLLIKTQDQSKQSLTNVFGSQPRQVWIEKDDMQVEVLFESLIIGDIVVVHAGEMVPIDGIITKGQASIDQRALTGESQPVEKECGDQVLASTTVIAGNICIKVQKIGKETIAAEIGDILNSSADYRTSVQSKGEEIVNNGSNISLALAVAALPLVGISGAIAALWSSFGMSMRLTAPMNVLNFLNRASQKGILVKDGRALELLSKVDTIVFDKTGTLTLEQPRVGKIHTYDGYTDDEILIYAAAAEYKQKHPIALAILQKASERGLQIPTIDEAMYEVGYGLRVKIGSQIIQVGSARFMVLEKIPVPVTAELIQTECHEQGHSLVYVAVDNRLAGAIELQTTIRPEVKEIIQALQQRDLSLYIISGDHEQPTKRLAGELGIKHYHAEVLPENKANHIQMLQDSGKSVCFIGDGINDAIALKQANVSISLSGASTLATDCAQIIMMDGTLSQLVTLFELAQNLEKNLKASLIASIVPGIIIISGVFIFHFGITFAVMALNIGWIANITTVLWPFVRDRMDLSIQSRSLDFTNNLLESTKNNSLHEIH